MTNDALKALDDAKWKGEPCDNPKKGWICDSRGNRLTKLGNRNAFGKIIKAHNQEIEVLQHKIRAALSAYEKLQGVDLDTVKEIEERWGDRFLELEEPVPEGMKRMGYVVDIHFLLTQLKSAKLVADIGGDG